MRAQARSPSNDDRRSLNLVLPPQLRNTAANIPPLEQSRLKAPERRNPRKRDDAQLALNNLALLQTHAQRCMMNAAQA
jgi:hypothetical protein